MPLRLTTRRQFMGRCTATLALAGTGLARANTDFPSKTINVIVPYAPGGQGDVFARLLGDPLSRALGQAVIVDNRPGASGALGTRIAAKAAPDGHTLLMGQTGEMVKSALK